MIRFKERYDVKAMTWDERRLFNIWKNMIQRCTNPRNHAYADYGGRGIKVCQKWLTSFKDYFDDIGLPPDNSYELDRIDNDKGYEPGNVRYVTHRDNMMNVRNNRYVTIEVMVDGVKKPITKTMSEWADEYGIDRPTFHSRLKMGWQGEALLANPRGENYVEIDGKNDTVANWARSIPLSITGFMARYNRGVRGKELLTPSRKLGGHIRSRLPRHQLPP